MGTAYDPNNLLPLSEEEAGEYDDNLDDIDWDDIIATTEPDFQAGRFSFNSEDYATDEEAREAFRAYLWGILEKVRDARNAEQTTVSTLDAKVS